MTHIPHQSLVSFVSSLILAFASNKPVQQSRSDTIGSPVSIELSRWIAVPSSSGQILKGQGNGPGDHIRWGGTSSSRPIIYDRTQVGECPFQFITSSSTYPMFFLYSPYYLLTPFSILYILGQHAASPPTSKSKWSKSDFHIREYGSTSMRKFILGWYYYPLLTLTSTMSMPPQHSPILLPWMVDQPLDLIVIFT